MNANGAVGIILALGLLGGCSSRSAAPTVVPEAAAPVEPAPSSPESSADALWDQAEREREDGNHSKALVAYRTFLEQHGDSPDLTLRILEAELRIGQAQDALGQRVEAERSYRATLRRFEDSGLSVGTEAADLPAEAQFRLAELATGDVLAREIQGEGADLEQSTKALFDALVQAVEAYDAVVSYERVNWALAAMYRRGEAFESVATKVREAPVPAQLEARSPAWRAYRDIVEDFAGRLDTKAIELYTWTVERGQQHHVSNHWTESAAERLRGHGYPGGRP